MSKHTALDTFGRSGNPAFGDKFEKDAEFSDLPLDQKKTLDGAVNKTGLLLAICFATAIYSWNFPSPVLIGIGFIGGFIAALVTIFKPEIAPTSAPIYAALEGLALGAISVVFENQYPGIVIQAIGLTFGILASLLIAYKTGLIKPTENFKLGLFAATGGIFLVYLVSIIMNMFGGAGISLIHSNGMFGIGFSLVVVVIASLNLVLDFDFIEQGAENSLPKYMEWYGAFSLMVTLIWLYLEILRLLSKLRR
ncbi:MAG: membrane protein [Gammaproteobacteria bacterium]|nr:MAG: membrane protein [Gammaproteobacteria bacterium]